MNWKTKAFIQRCLDAAPFGKTIYHTGQRTVGQLRNFPIDGKVRQAIRMIEGLARTQGAQGAHGGGLEGLSTVEIGTGWVPVIPLFLWLLGQKECHTYDTSRLLVPSLTLAIARQLLTHPLIDQLLNQPTFPLQQPVRFQERKRALEALVKRQASSQEILDHCGIRYHAPADASQTSLPPHSIDLVFSNTVLEHIPTTELPAIFTETQRILRPAGYAMHLIDMSDHYAHSDESITSINFLQFSEQEFARYNTTFLYQNRWRASDWRQFFTDSGFAIATWQPHVNERALRQFSSFPLHASFASLSTDDLCTSSVCVLATAS